MHALMATFSKGELQSVDGYMNIALEQTREIVEGSRVRRNYGDAFIRGNNGMHLRNPPSERASKR